LGRWVCEQRGDEGEDFECRTKVAEKVEFSEQYGRSPGEVPDSPSRGEGLKVEDSKLEENPKTQQQQARGREPTADGNRLHARGYGATTGARARAYGGGVGL
jgi:hypothetical protein